MEMGKMVRGREQILGEDWESIINKFNKSLWLPSGNFEKTVGYEYLEFGRVVWSRVINLRVPMCKLYLQSYTR